MGVPLSHWMKNPESKAKMIGNRNGAGKRPLVICVYCGKTGGKPLMTRYHFDNCKSI